MSEVVTIKTQQNTANVEDFINKVDNEQQCADSFAIIEMMKKLVAKNQKCGELKLSVLATKDIKA